MVELVATAFAKPGQRLMIEAPTGTGKTLAYLVPAIEAARASGRVAVVAPHSRVLQDQILETLEELESTLQPFSVVVLKGRQNYISLKALGDELEWLQEDSGEIPAGHATAMALAILCGWVAQTPSGDWSDLRTAAVEGSLRVLRQLRWKLSVDSRPGPVRSRLDELDFYRRALARLDTAHVAVLNHALLAASPALKAGHFNLIVDEAHNLEDSAHGRHHPRAELRPPRDAVRLAVGSGHAPRPGRPRRHRNRRGPARPADSTAPRRDRSRAAGGGSAVRAAHRACA